MNTPSDHRGNSLNGPHQILPSRERMALEQGRRNAAGLPGARLVSGDATNFNMHPYSGFPEDVPVFAAAEKRDGFNTNETTKFRRWAPIISNPDIGETAYVPSPAFTSRGAVRKAERYYQQGQYP